jgi:hypothetical protein
MIESTRFENGQKHIHTLLHALTGEGHLHRQLALMGYTGLKKKTRRNNDVMRNLGSWPSQCCVNPSGKMNINDWAMQRMVTNQAQ